MKWRFVRLRVCTAVGVTAVAGWLLSCGSAGDTVHAGPRRTMLNDLANVVIVPAYEDLATDADALAAALDQLDDHPDAASLAAAQNAWRRTRAAWKQSEAFAIGPAETLRTASKIDWSPIRADRIESEINGTADLTADYVEDLGADIKGFLALEYLLFDPDGGDAAVIGGLAGAPRRRQLARALAENLRDQTAELRDAWSPSVGNFAEVLGDAGSGNPVFPTVKSAVDTVVNQLIFLSEDIADAQLLAVLGRNGGPPQPDALDAHRSQNGLADLLANLTGIQDVYFTAYGGRRGMSFAEIVDDIDSQTANALSLAINRAVETASSIPPPLEQSVLTDEDAIAHAQVRAKDLMRRFEIDLVTVLGTTLRFNPNDGD